MNNKKYDLNRNKYLNEKEIKRLELNLAELLEEDLDRFLPILIAFKTGCRKSELKLLKVENVYFPDKTLWIMATKKSADREIPLSDEVLELIKRYIRKNKLKKSDLLFFGKDKVTKEKIPFADRTMDRIWLDARPVDKKFHSLRHTFALEIYKKHRDVNLVKAALGHRNIQNTMIYVEYVFKTQEMRRLLIDDLKAS